MPDQHGQPTLQKSSTSPAPDNGPVDGNMVIARPSGGSAKGLLDLPAELRLCVFDFLPDHAPADLAALARTCKALWLPAARALYRHITLESDMEIDYRVYDYGKLVRFLRLIHNLLLSDKPFSTMTEQLRIEIKDPRYLGHKIHSILPDDSHHSEIVSLSTTIGMHIAQEMERPRPSDMLFDWRDIVGLILQRSPNLRYFGIVGYSKTDRWDLQLDHCRKLEIVYLHSPSVLTLKGLAGLALISSLKSLQLSFMGEGWDGGQHFAFSSILQGQFPSLVHLNITEFQNAAVYMPDLITMVPTLRSLELGWAYCWQGVGNLISHFTLSSILNGTHSSPTRPKPRLGETLEKMRVHTSLWHMESGDPIMMSLWMAPAAVRHEEKNVKMWNERFFGSLKFLRSLKLLEIPLLAPVHRIIHLLPDSLEELHLADDNLSFFDLTGEFERISAVLPQLGPTAGLHNMKAVFLKFRRLDPSPCQQIMDRMKEICRESDIKLNVVLNYVPEREWGMKENGWHGDMIQRQRELFDESVI